MNKKAILSLFSIVIIGMAAAAWLVQGQLGSLKAQVNELQRQNYELADQLSELQDQTSRLELEKRNYKTASTITQKN